MKPLRGEVELTRSSGTLSMPGTRVALLRLRVTKRVWLRRVSLNWIL